MTNSPALETIRRLEERLAEARRGLAEAEKCAETARARWQQTVADGNNRSELAARKTMDSALETLQIAEQRIEPLERTLVQAKREAVPGLAAEYTARLAEINSAAATDAETLGDAMDTAYALALEINRRHRMFQAEIEAFLRTARELGVPNARLSGVRFAANLPLINSTVKLNVAPRFRLGRASSLATGFALEAAEGEVING